MDFGTHSLEWKAFIRRGFTVTCLRTQSETLRKNSKDAKDVALQSLNSWLPTYPELWQMCPFDYLLEHYSQSSKAGLWAASGRVL